MFPTRSSRGLFILVWNQLSIHYSLGSRLDFDTGDQPWTKPFCSRKISRTLLRVRRRPFVDLTAACDAVWHRGLACKLLRLLPDKHMIRIILKLIQNRNFTLTTGDSKRSRFRHLRNGVPQESVLAPFFLISIYTIFLPQPSESMLMPMIWLCCIHLETGRGWGNL